MKNKPSLLIVHVAGLRADGTPDEAGRKRLDKAASLIRDGEYSAIAIIGGKSKRCSSHAQAYANFLHLIWVEAASKVVIVRASSTNANREIEASEFGIVEWVTNQDGFRSTFRIGIIGYDLFLRRMKDVFNHLDFENVEMIESGEKPAYNKAMDLLLLWLSKIDPTWGWLCLPLHWLSIFLIERPSK
jgi:hypothetical protein